MAVWSGLGEFGSGGGAGIKGEGVWNRADVGEGDVINSVVRMKVVLVSSSERCFLVA